MRPETAVEIVRLNMVIVLRYRIKQCQCGEVGDVGECLFYATKMPDGRVASGNDGSRCTDQDKGEGVYYVMEIVLIGL
jgi:hypothetical protein